MLTNNFIFSEPITTPSHLYPFLNVEHRATPEKVNYFENTLSSPPTTRRDTLMYLHIPYCLTNCDFCHCFRTTLPGGQNYKDVLDEYLQWLYKEMDLYAKTEYVGDLRKIHIGGGTPSLLSVDQFKGLMDKLTSTFSFPDGIELNIEGEILTLKNEEKIAAFAEYNTTRVSFGVQTFDENCRNLCNLKPKQKDILECMEKLRKYGFDVTIDLLYGLPGQDLKVLETDLRSAVENEVMSVDIYKTNIYPELPIYKNHAETHKEMFDERLRFDMFGLITDFFKTNGYVQKTDEIFSKPEAPFSALKEGITHCGENRVDMLAMGAGVYNCLERVISESCSINEYKKKLSNNEFPLYNVYEWKEEDELTFMAIRGLCRGLKISKQDKFYNAFQKRYEEKLNRFKKYDLIEETEDQVKLTEQGILWHQNIIYEFLTEKQIKNMEVSAMEYMYINK